jgi:hypothetical protein
LVVIGERYHAFSQFTLFLRSQPCVVILVKIVQTEIGGQKVFITVYRWENPDNPDGTKRPAGFTKGLLLSKDPNVKDLTTEEAFKRTDGTGSFIPVGAYIDLNRPDMLQSYFSRGGANSAVLIDWYKKNQKIVFNQKFWEQCEKTGIIENEIKNSDGKTETFIPTSLIYGVAY